MQSRSWRSWCIAVAASVVAGCGSQVDEASRTLTNTGTASSSLELVPQTFSWDTVVNNATEIPGAGKNFSSYNQPSVNGRGLVVFRARSTGGGSGPARGVFTRDMAVPGSAVGVIAQNGTVVPQPNNVTYGGDGTPATDGTPAAFTEFPSIPRIDVGTSTIATRGQSRPVWSFWDGYIGTSGIYATPFGQLMTGASLLGAVTDYSGGPLVFPWFQVPGAQAGTRFDQFPGAPGLAGAKTIVFKGNWTDEKGVGRTGVYYRNLSLPDNFVSRVADSYATNIPDTNLPFGSTAPPSGALRNGSPHMVFVGFYSEEQPELGGGVYMKELTASSTLKALAKIGGPVPGFNGKPLGSDTFKAFGEGLSFDGRFVAFWGAWGDATREIVLTCPTDGNEAVKTWCWDHSPTEMVNGEEVHTGEYRFQVPVNQGLFVHDLNQRTTFMLARTGGASDIRDFLFWNYSGRPPGTGEGDEDTQEPPRWRSNAFAAVNSPKMNTVRLAFKALKDDGSSGIYLVNQKIVSPKNVEVLPRTVVDTNTLATTIDPAAISRDSKTLAPVLDANGNPVAVLYVTTVGIERDAFRSGTEDVGSFLVLNASMADATATYAWGGIYLTRLPNDD